MPKHQFKMKNIFVDDDRNIEMDCCGPFGMAHGPKGFKKFKKFKGFRGFGHRSFQTVDDGNLKITFMLPGMKKDSLKIKAKVDKISITAERRDDLVDHFGTKEVSFVSKLEEEVVAESAKASYNDGVLSVTFPLANPEPEYEISDIE